MTTEEVQLVASLKSDPAYLLVIDKLQALVDTYTDSLGSIVDEKKTQELLPYWRALRTIVSQLRTTPEDMLTLLENEKGDYTPSINQPTSQKLREIMKQMQQNQQSKNEYDPYREVGMNPGWNNLT